MMYKVNQVLTTHNDLPNWLNRWKDEGWKTVSVSAAFHRKNDTDGEPSFYMFTVVLGRE